MPELTGMLEGLLAPSEYARLLEWLSGREETETWYALGSALGYLQRTRGNMLPKDLDEFLEKGRKGQN